VSVNVGSLVKDGVAGLVAVIRVSGVCTSVAEGLPRMPQLTIVTMMSSRTKEKLDLEFIV
jgi:hypothetical protein